MRTLVILIIVGKSSPPDACGAVAAFRRRVTLCGWQDGKGPQVKPVQEEVACQGTIVDLMGPNLAQGHLILWCALGSVMLRQISVTVTFQLMIYMCQIAKKTKKQKNKTFFLWGDLLAQ